MITMIRKKTNYQIGEKREKMSPLGTFFAQFFELES